jgi:hypothetical protein
MNLRRAPPVAGIRAEAGKMASFIASVRWTAAAFMEIFPSIAHMDA